MPKLLQFMSQKCQKQQQNQRFCSFVATYAIGWLINCRTSFLRSWSTILGPRWHWYLRILHIHAKTRSELQTPHNKNTLGRLGCLCRSWNRLISYFEIDYSIWYRGSQDIVITPSTSPLWTFEPPHRPILTCQKAKNPCIDPFYRWWWGVLGCIWRCCSDCVTEGEVLHRWSTPSLPLNEHN